MLPSSKTQNLPILKRYIKVFISQKTASDWSSHTVVTCFRLEERNYAPSPSGWAQKKSKTGLGSPLSPSNHTHSKLCFELFSCTLQDFLIVAPNLKLNVVDLNLQLLRNPFELHSHLASQPFRATGGDRVGSQFTKYAKDTLRESASSTPQLWADTCTLSKSITAAPRSILQFWNCFGPF